MILRNIRQNFQENKDESKLDSLILRIKRIKNNIIHERKLKLRKRRNGRKVLMDENYEIFLAKAIENKVTVHCSKSQLCT